MTVLFDENGEDGRESRSADALCAMTRTAISLGLPSFPTPPWTDCAGSAAHLDNLHQVLLRKLLPVRADRERRKRSFPIVSLAKKRCGLAGCDCGEAVGDGGTADCGRNRQYGGAWIWKGSSAPMANASVARSSGAVWNGVSKTPSMGAKRMSQKVRTNCKSAKLSGLQKRNRKRIPNAQSW